MRSVNRGRIEPTVTLGQETGFVPDYQIGNHVRREGGLAIRWNAGQMSSLSNSHYRRKGDRRQCSELVWQISHTQ
jgi:hypothetical protein